MIPLKLTPWEAIGGARRVAPETWPMRGAKRHLISAALAAAALALAVALHGPPRRASELGDVRRSLAAELGAVDLGPGRFVGLGYSPFRSGSRPALSTLRALDRRLGMALERSPHRLSHLTDAAILRLLSGDIDDAVRLLEKGLSVAPSDPELLTDLAAVRLRAAHLGKGVHHRALALDAAERAVRAAPHLAEARFNQAAALQQAGLPVQARLAWARYLQLDAVDEWDEEAKGRLEALPRQTREQRWKRVQTQLAAACRASDDAAVRRLLPGFGFETRGWIEIQLLPRWAGAVQERRWAAAEDALVLASCLASARAEVFRSPLLADGIAKLKLLLERRDLVAIDRLAAAQIELSQGLALAADLQVSAAADRLVAAEVALGRGGSPVALRAAVELAAARFQEHDHPQALAILDEIDRSPEGRGDAGVRARVLWLRGLVHFIGARNELALRSYLEGLAAAKIAQDKTTEATLTYLIGETLVFTGAEEAAWPYVLAAVNGLTEVSDTRTALRVVSGASYAALHTHRLGAAIGFQREATRLTLASGQPTQGVLALLRRARLENRLGDQVAALRDLAAAERMALEEPAGELREGLLADLALGEGEAEIASGDFDAASDAYGRAIYGFEVTGNQFPLVRALAGRAEALRRAGSPARARADLARGVRQVLRQRPQVAADQQVAFLDAAAPLFEELVASLAETERRPDRALLVADLLKARTLVEGGPEEDLEDEAAPRLLDELHHALAPDNALIEVLVLPDRSYVWFVDASGWSYAPVAAGAEQLTAEVERFRRHLLRGDGGCPQGRALFDRLLGPFRDRLRPGSTLFVVADGPLHRLPFGALCSRSGRLLADDYALARLPSAAYLVAASRQAPPAASATPPRKALVVGDPAVDQRLFRQLAPLTASRAEAEAVAARYPAARLLLGIEASRSELLAALPEFEMIHISAHSLIREPAMGGSALVLAPGVEHAGLLSERDIAGLGRLARHSIVVLPVCGSGSGQSSRSEGQLSLARAFLRAGAAGVVATLWPVADEGAAAFSHEFHRRLSAGVPALDAVRQTQQSLRLSADPRLAAPSVWAAFELIGLGAPAAPS